MSTHLSPDQQLSPHSSRLSDFARLRLFSLVGVFAVLLLFLPSLLLLDDPSGDIAHLQSGWSFDGYGFLLEDIDSTTEIDPVGYGAIINTAFFRMEPSTSFLAPAPSNLPVSPPIQAEFSELESLTSQLNLMSRQVTKEMIETGHDTNGLVGCQKFGAYSSDGLILALSQPVYHFVVLLEAGSGYVYVFSPLTGRAIYPCETFINIWEGSALTVH